MALATLPRTLRALNVYVDGDSYAGRCDNITLPVLNATVESHRAAGMNAPVEIETGMEQMTTTMVFSDIDPKFLTLLNTPDAKITLRGSAQSQGQDAEPVIINMRGLFKGVELGQWQSGGKPTVTVNASLTYYRYRQKDIEYAEIDIVNMVQKFGGVDQMSKHRENIGI